ncbi:MAG: ABC transporter permease [Actinomycetes bacterium]
MSSIAQPHSARAEAAIAAATEEARLAAAGRTDAISGPRAIGVPLKRFAALVWTIAVSQFKLKFYGSALGYLWQLMRPLLMFGVLYLFFTQILRFPEVQYYPVVLLQGIVVFTFLSEATVGSVGSLVENEILVRKIQFPRLAVPFAIVLAALFNLLINYVVVLVFLIIQGGGPMWTWLYEFPILLLLLVVLATAISTLLSALFVRYRDIRPIWEVLLQTIYFVSLVLIPVEAVTNTTLRKLLLINPFACLIEQLRHAVISASAPTVLEVFGNPWLLALPVTIAVALCVIAFIVFDRMAPKVAEEL